MNRNAGNHLTESSNSTNEISFASSTQATNFTPTASSLCQPPILNSNYQPSASHHLTSLSRHLTDSAPSTSLDHSQSQLLGLMHTTNVLSRILQYDRAQFILLFSNRHDLGGLSKDGNQLHSIAPSPPPNSLHQIYVSGHLLLRRVLCRFFSYVVQKVCAGEALGICVLETLMSSVILLHLMVRSDNLRNDEDSKCTGKGKKVAFTEFVPQNLLLPLLNIKSRSRRRPILWRHRCVVMRVRLILFAQMKRNTGKLFKWLVENPLDFVPTLQLLELCLEDAVKHRVTLDYALNERKNVVDALLIFAETSHADAFRCLCLSTHHVSKLSPPLALDLSDLLLQQTEFLLLSNAVSSANVLHAEAEYRIARFLHLLKFTLLDVNDLWLERVLSVSMRLWDVGATVCAASNQLAHLLVHILSLCDVKSIMATTTELLMHFLHRLTSSPLEPSDVDLLELELSIIHESMARIRSYASPATKLHSSAPHTPLQPHHRQVSPDVHSSLTHAESNVGASCDSDDTFTIETQDAVQCSNLYSELFEWALERILLEDLSLVDLFDSSEKLFPSHSASEIRNLKFFASLVNVSFFFISLFRHNQTLLQSHVQRLIDSLSESSQKSDCYFATDDDELEMDDQCTPLSRNDFDCRQEQIQWLNTFIITSPFENASPPIVATIIPSSSSILARLDAMCSLFDRSPSFQCEMDLDGAVESNGDGVDQQPAPSQNLAINTFA